MHSLKSPSTAGGKQRACARCKQHKAKCVGDVPCRRCLETGVECVPQTKITNQPIPDRVSRLEADVARLKALLRASPDSECDSRARHEQREESEEDEGDITLIENVRLGKRTRRWANGGEIKEELAFKLFMQNVAFRLCFIDPCTTRNSIPHNSLLYWATIAIGSREGDDLAATFELARRRVLDYTTRTVFTHPTKDDLKGMLMVYMWLDHFRTPGHPIALAHELNLRGTLDRLSLIAQPGNAFEAEYTEVLHIYGFLFRLDRIASLFTGNPRMMTPGHFAGQVRYLLHRPDKRIGDVRLVAQVEVMVLIAGNIQDDFFPDHGGMTNALSRSAEYDASFDSWLSSWLTYIERFAPSLTTSDRDQDASALQTLKADLQFIWVSAKFHIKTFALRGLMTVDASSAQDQTVREGIALAIDCCELAVKTFSPSVAAYLSNMIQLQMTYAGKSFPDHSVGSTRTDSGGRAAIFLARMMRFLPQHHDERGVSAARGIATLLSTTSAAYYGERIESMLEKIRSPAHPHPQPPPVWSGDPSSTFWDWVGMPQPLSAMGEGMGGVAVNEGQYRAVVQNNHGMVQNMFIQP
ncbi:hypothetical protein P7C73_g5276, partial [Tremellales sp. Uapishka_1]